ncbi:MAG: phosphoribose diphosphate:decaprenyl-phosphate phosphoribosyltransferase [Candidatus Nomurabacteria bacterium]|nr:phosphoribose diphosphate:decaprenyl-phosphate phosphoribosyltransferase [Candidatus Nomurabacteria bacterium]
MEYLRLLRPYNWIKNFLVFIPLFFAKQLFIPGKLSSVFLSFMLFCLVASFVYIVNDLVDVEQDRQHSKKQHRPIASGKVSPRQASMLLAVVGVLIVTTLSYFSHTVIMLMAVYLILNILYSLYLKHIAILDILLIAGFYLLRVLVGGAVAQVPISHWLTLSTIFLALFLITGKRKAEMAQTVKRKVLDLYTPEVLNAILIISVTLVIVSFSLYTVLVLATTVAVYSIFFILLAILRYLLLISTTDKVEYPEKALFSDWWIFLATLGWLICMYIVLYR